ncbi:hypothetical protein CAEBREN_12654 [Caenorhabditis brenneri]|uniref:CUB-like domain-containing protein n=1 Tax=Caenorhabditis brenneri TaxID=135651 RepID=G0MRT1_CAEBE|nr:hypothetical protein CAEBREN_12654 [Caenorhabditis brenneri]
MQQLIILVLLVLPAPSLGGDVTCPVATITENTPVGAFPAEGSAVFPANYNCTIQFQIPAGQIVKINVTNNLLFDSPDSFTIQDSALALHRMYIVDDIFYLPATIGKIQITTETNTSSFYFTWQYIDITTFERIQKPTGTILALNLTANTFYQFISSRGGVAFHTSSISGYTDTALAQIYVYDGADLNAKFIGNLKVFTETDSVSKGRSLTLVNFYGASVPSYGIANDYAAISIYDGYFFHVLRSDIDFFTHQWAKKGMESAITFYSIDSQESYITYLNFTNPDETGHEVRVKPMTPMENYTDLLTYNVDDSTDGQVPQQILINTFTVTFYQCDVYLNIISRPSLEWSTVKPGRTGWVYSPSIWNPTENVTTPYYNYFNSTNPVKFVFDIQSVAIEDSGEKLKVEVGSPTSSNFAVVFNTTVTNTGEKAAHGTYMTTNFTGISNASSFAMKFTVENNVETATKSVRRISVFMALFASIIFNFVI